MKTVSKPAVISSPFASLDTAVKNQIPLKPTGSFKASLAEGFPPITMKPKELGGIPPEGGDFNGILNLLSSHNFALQNGYLPTFEKEVSDAIGGYGKGAVLFYYTSSQAIPVISKIENNIYNFNEDNSFIGKYWNPANLQTFLSIEKIEEKTQDFEVVLDNHPIKKIEIKGSSFNINLSALKTSSFGSWTHELHIKSENKPFINWNSNIPLKWLITSPTQIEYENLTNIFIFRAEENQIIASFGGAY